VIGRGKGKTFGRTGTPVVERTTEGPCTDPSMGKYLLCYEARLLGEEAERKFEAHILECDSCYEELRLLSEVEEMLGETLAGRTH